MAEAALSEAGNVLLRAGRGVPADYNSPVPETEYLVFQGEPFREEDYAQAILAVEWAMEKYDPALIGRQWDDKEPRIQL